MEDQYFLGIDVSTQSLKICVIDQNHKLIYDSKVEYKDLVSNQPVILLKQDEQSPSCTAEQDVFLFLQALEHELSSLQNNFKGKINSISVSGQQHGSVYYSVDNINFDSIEDSEINLSDFLKDSYSTNLCPIWMDSSTSAQCKEIENKFPNLLSETGSRAFERFTLCQIMKKQQLQNEIYSKTKHISLISSFVTEIFVGKFVSIDIGDASGMNLMNLRTKSYIKDILHSIENLDDKIGQYSPAMSWTLAGNISSYFIKKYSSIFDQQTQIVYGTGDNLASMVGIGLLQENEVAISLGTSDTLFGIINEGNLDHSLNRDISILCSPLNAHQYLVLLCQKNGGLMREKLLKENKLSWEELIDFYLNKYQRKGLFGVFLDLPEIVPPINSTVEELRCTDSSVDMTQISPHERIICALEYKMLSLKLHFQKEGICIKKLILTGGGAKNIIIQHIAANVFNSPVFIQDSQDSAVVGSALRACHGYLCHQTQQNINYADQFSDSVIYKANEVAKPEENLVQYYQDLIIPISKLEQELICLHSY